MTYIDHVIAYKLGELGPFFAMYDEDGAWVETVSNIDYVRVDPLSILNQTGYKTNFNQLGAAAPTHK